MARSFKPTVQVPISIHPWLFPSIHNVLIWNKYSMWELYVSWYILLGPAGLETNYKLKHVERKAVNQSKAKHCRAANEVAGEGYTGRPPSCHSLLLKDTAWKRTPFTILDQTAAGVHCCSSSPNQKHSRSTSRQPVWKWALDHGPVPADVFKEERKRNYVGSVCLTPEKSFALMALRGLASTHWADMEMNTGD